MSLRAAPVTRAIACAIAAAACGEPAARVTLVATSGGCGRPALVTELRLIAYAGGGETVRSIPLDADTTELDDLPADTEQLGIEVVGGGGVVAAVGKTAPFDFRGLPDGAQLAVFMAPVDDFCPAGDLIEPRVAPLVARTTTGVLVVGGRGAGGAALGTAERYDPATNTFVPVAVPPVLGRLGFVGAQLAPMPDGRVVVTGGRQAAIAVYDPATDAFGETTAILEERAHHGAIALDATHVLTTGGCPVDMAGACVGPARSDSHAYDVDRPSSDNAPRTTLVAGRLGATVFELGVLGDGRRGYVAIGGSPAPGAADPTAADRFAIDDEVAAAIGGTHAQPAQLDGGGVLTAFAPDEAPPQGAASVVPAGGAAARPVAGTAARARMRLVTLEDGRVLGLGGEQASAVRYDPTTDAWQTIDLTPSADRPGARPGPLAAPALIRLADGAVLVLGGAAGGTASAKAWIFRPPLLGPTSGAVTVVPAGPPRPTVLTPADPATVSRAGGAWTLAAGGAGELARALVGGPRMTDGSVRATVRVRSGGVALIAQQQAPARALVGELVPGAPARIVRLDGAAARTLCRGTEVPAFDPDVGANVSLAIDGGRIELVHGTATLASCALDGSARGAWGVGAVGGEVIVDTVAVAR